MWAEERKKKRWGETGGKTKERRSLLSPSPSLPSYFFLALWRSAALHYLNAWNRLQRCLCLNQGRDLFSRTIVRHQVPVYIPFLLVLCHSTALCSLLTSCFKRHLTGLHGVTMYRQYTVTCRVLKVWIKHNFILIPRHWFPSTECGQSVKMNTGVREPSRPSNLVPRSPTAKGKKTEWDLGTRLGT